MTALPYVYKCINKETGEFYIGYRECNELPAKEDILIYKSSAPYVNLKFSEFDSQIIQELSSGDEAYDLEQRLISESWNDPLLLNKSCFHGKLRFRRCGPLTENSRRKLSLVKTGTKMSDDAKRKMSLAHKGKLTWNKGIPATAELKEKISRTLKEKYETQVHHLKGKPSPKKGMPSPLKGRPSGPKATFVCEHCEKQVGGASNYLRWHHDNCKSK